MSVPTKPTGRELYTAAAEYLARGWSCIPLKHDKKAACAWKRWQKERAGDAQMRRWFIEGRGVKYEVVGVGIIGGAVSGGLAVRDFDDEAAYIAWTKAHADLAGTLPTVATPRPGYHVYFLAPGIGTRTQGDGELRGEGAYVAAPPTLHPSGRQYTWINRLPDGPLPTVSDLAAAGLVRGGHRRPLLTLVASGLAAVGLSGGGDTIPFVTTTAKQVERGSNHPPTPPQLESLVSLAPLVPLGMQVGERLGMHDKKNRILAAIESTLPRATGQRHKRLFIFAGKCRAIGGPDAKAGDFRADVKQWHILALPIIGTKEWAETWADFCASFQDVKRPREGSDLAEILVATDGEALPACAADYADTPVLCRLVKMCRALQRTAGAGVAFYLCQRAAGAALGVDQASVSRYLAAMQVDGIIRRTYQGHTGRASEYVYIGEAGVA